MTKKMGDIRRKKGKAPIVDPAALCMFTGTDWNAGFLSSSVVREKDCPRDSDVCKQKKSPKPT